MPKRKKKSIDEEKEAPVGNVYEFVAAMEDPDFRKKPCTKINYGTVDRSNAEFIQFVGLGNF